MSSPISATIMTANHEFSTNTDVTFFAIGDYYTELVLILAFLAGFLLCRSKLIQVVLEWPAPPKKSYVPCAKMLEEKEDEDEVPLPFDHSQNKDEKQEEDDVPLQFDHSQNEDEKQEHEQGASVFNCGEGLQVLAKEVSSQRSVIELGAYKSESEDPFFNEALAAAAQLPVSNENTSYSWFEASTKEEAEEHEEDFVLRGASVEEALCQWRCCLEKSGDPQGHMLGAVLEVCLAAGAIDEAYDVASETCWSVPSCPTGQTALLRLIEGLAERGKLYRAYEAYSNTHANGLEVDVHMYNTMLTAAAQAADLEKLERLFSDLVDAGIEPEYSTFSTAVRGCCAAGNLDKAMALFSTMRQHGVAPGQALFNALLDCCARKHLVVLAEQIMEDMMDSSVHPNSTTVTILIRLYGHARDLSNAFRVTEELSERYKIELTGDTYGALIAASLLNNQLDSALGIFEDMPTEGCVLPARTYGILITACLRDGDLASAVELVNHAFALDRKGQQPRARLERSLLEDVLRLIGRRRQSATLGAPLLQRLLEANVEISDTLVASVRRDAERPAPASLFHSRRSKHDSWRRILTT